MRKALLPLLLIFCLLLTGCGGKALEKRFAEFSEALGEKESLSFSADLRAEYTDRTLSFTLDYSRDPDGQTIAVREPERIAGIRAHLAPGSSTLEFEEQGAPVYRLILDDHLSATVWFAPESMTPTRAEIQSDETVRIFCEIHDWR